MAMRLFLIYVIVELAVVLALASTIGFGWTLLVLLGTFLLGIALAGSQLRRQLERLRQGVNGAQPDGHFRVADSVLVAMGTVLVFIPGLVTSVAGLLMLLPPTRAAVRPLAGFLVARGITRRVAFIDLNGVSAAVPNRGRGNYIDGEVVDVVDSTVVDSTVVDSTVDNPAAPAVVRKPE